MSNADLRRLLMDGMDAAHEECDGRVPAHCILPKSMEDEVRLEVLAPDREYVVVSDAESGLLGMQVWFSRALDRRGKTALLVSNDVFEQFFDTSKDFVRAEPEKLEY